MYVKPLIKVNSCFMVPPCSLAVSLANFVSYHDQECYSHRTYLSIWSGEAPCFKVICCESSLARIARQAALPRQYVVLTLYMVGILRLFVVIFVSTGAIAVFGQILVE